MTVYVLWFDDGNRASIVGIFKTRESAHNQRDQHDVYDRACMSVEEFDLFD